MKRREFLKLIAAGSAVAAGTSCQIQSARKVIPYVIPPEEEIIPGVPVFNPSTCTECPAGCGLLVKSYDKEVDERRELCPVKLEGLPHHPINDGALCIRGQASLTRLYHPDRIKQPRMRDASGEAYKATWQQAYERISKALSEASAAGKTNVYLSGVTTGSLSRLIDEFCRQTKVTRWKEYEPFCHAALRQANQLVFGRSDVPAYRIENADFLLTIGADIMETFVSPVSYGTQYAKRLNQGSFDWVHVEPHYSLTGYSADDRLVIHPGAEALLLQALLMELVKSGKTRNSLPQNILAGLSEVSPEELEKKTGITQEQVYQIAEKMSGANHPLIITGGAPLGHGDSLQAAVLTSLIQWAMKMVNVTVDFDRPENYQNVGSLPDMKSLTELLDQQKIGVIFISRTDPAATLPGDLKFAEVLKKASLRVGMGDLETNTMSHCDVILPLSHALESWGDSEPRGDVLSIIQPTLKPIHDSWSEGDIQLQLIKSCGGYSPAEDYQTYLLDQWKAQYGPGSIQTLLDRGFLVKSSSEKWSLPAPSAEVASVLKSMGNGEISGDCLYLIPSLRTFDGRSSRLPLLNEIPDPLTTLTYGSWVSISKETADSLNLKDGDVVSISTAQGEFQLPAISQHELPGGVLMVQWGNELYKPFGMDPQSGELICKLAVEKITPTGEHVRLPILSGSKSQEGRGVIPDPVGHEEHHEHNLHAGGTSLYPKVEHKDYRWGMVIDLDSCTGCSACVAACYVENNVPVVGPELHLGGREMSWLRIEPYHEDFGATLQPMLCQQCDYAPCESVCPVFAAYHNPEGLNAQVYNRCVGTRYCSNNCPYKVRRFNWAGIDLPKPMERMLNPEVMHRVKGVMEKCTFCVQRIRLAKDHAKDQKRKVLDGEVVPACAQTCPARAITFGNMMDTTSKVYRLAHSERVYRVFEHLGIEPAVYYLQKKRPQSEKSHGHEGH